MFPTFAVVFFSFFLFLRFPTFFLGEKNRLYLTIDLLLCGLWIKLSDLQFSIADSVTFEKL